MQNGIFAPPNGGFTGATPHRDGQPGPVPVPKAGQQGAFLRASGTWERPPFEGDAATNALSSDLALTASSPRALSVAPTTVNRAVTLPDATTMPLAGGPVFIIANAGTVPMQVRTYLGVTPVAELAPGQIAAITLIAKASADGAWRAAVSQMGIAAPGTIFGGRQVLLTIQPSNINLYPSSSPTKYLLSYCLGSNVYGAVLTVTGKDIAISTPVAVGTYSSTDSGQICLLSDTTAIAVVLDAGVPVLKIQGYAVNLTTGVLTPVGSAVNLTTALTTTPLPVRLNKVTGQVALVSWNSGSSGTNLCCALIRFDGTAVTAGAITSGIDTPGNGSWINNVVLSATKAHLYCYRGTNSDHRVRELTLDTGALTIAVGAVATLGGSLVSSDAHLVAVDATYSLLLARHTSGGPQTRAVFFNGASLSGPHQTVSTESFSRLLPATWGGANPLMTLICTDTATGFYKTYAVDMFMLAANPYPIVDDQVPRRIAVTVSSALNPGSFLSAFARVGTQGVYVCLDQTAGGYLSAFTMERL